MAARRQRLLSKDLLGERVEARADLGQIILPRHQHAAQLRPAVDANFERWPVLGEYVWPNDEGAEDRESWEEELAYLKGWVLARAEWMDARL